MKVYFDTEFIDDGKTIELLSLGAVREDGAEFYGVNLSADRSKAGHWVQEHVLPHLAMPLGGVPGLSTVSAPHAELGRRFAGWAFDSHPDRLEFWGYFPAYDWVAVCQLYGTMLDVPGGFPHRPNDLRQWLNERGYSTVSPPDGHIHHALLDARWVRETHTKLRAVSRDLSTITT